MYKKISIFTFLFVVVDQIIKQVVSSFISYQYQIDIIPKFFYLTNVHNEGAAWSLFSGNVFFLALIGFFALVFIYYFFLKEKNLSQIEIVLYSLLIGGIIGNLIDRVFLGYVVDYIGIILIHYYFPIFNFADMGIVLSVIAMLVLSIKEEYGCKKSQ